MEARALMLKGVEELADAVKVTMGPKVTKLMPDSFLAKVVPVFLFNHLFIRFSKGRACLLDLGLIFQS